MQSIDHVVLVDVKIKGVVRVLGVVRMAPQRLLPADHLAHVLDDGVTLGDILQREYALAMHAGAAGLDAAPARCFDLLGHDGKKFVNVNSYGRACVRSRMCVHPRARKTVDCSQMKTLVIAEKPSVAQDIVRALTPVAGKFEKHDEHFENE